MECEKCVGTREWRSLRGIFYDYYPSCVSGNASTNCKSRQSTEWDTRPKIVRPWVRTDTVRKDIMCSAAGNPSLFRSPLITESRSCLRSNQDRPRLSLSSTKERLCSCIDVKSVRQIKRIYSHGPTEKSAPIYAHQSTALSTAVCMKQVTQE